MPNKKQPIEAVKKELSQVKWHDVNLLATTGSDIRLWPSIDYPSGTINQSKGLDGSYITTRIEIRSWPSLLII